MYISNKQKNWEHKTRNILPTLLYVDTLQQHSAKAANITTVLATVHKSMSMG